MRNRSQPERVADIGGGISGLAATCKIRRMSLNGGAPLLESGSRQGGVIKTPLEDRFMILAPMELAFWKFTRRLNISGEPILRHVTHQGELAQ